VHVADVERSLLAELLGVAIATLDQPTLNLGLGVGAIAPRLVGQELLCGTIHTSSGVIGRTSSPSMVTIPDDDAMYAALIDDVRRAAAVARIAG
jgi:hypothetical protein